CVARPGRLTRAARGSTRRCARAGHSLMASLDALVYGGLVRSRTSTLALEDALGGLDELSGRRVLAFGVKRSQR
ncbi:MAG: hypothetical protein RMK51_12625, partial [Meiothermus sp.]|nr:hypothetical protein [Meiothermus sp.]